MAVNPPPLLSHLLPLLGAAMLALLPWPARADQTDPGLDGLFDLLTTSSSRQAAGAAEAEIWRIWIESGREDIDALMAEGLAAMNNQQFEHAIDLFGQITRRAPAFAEVGTNVPRPTISTTITWRRFGTFRPPWHWSRGTSVPSRAWA